MLVVAVRNSWIWTINRRIKWDQIKYLGKNRNSHYAEKQAINRSHSIIERGQERRNTTIINIAINIILIIIRRTTHTKDKDMTLSIAGEDIMTGMRIGNTPRSETGIIRCTWSRCTPCTTTRWCSCTTARTACHCPSHPLILTCPWGWLCQWGSQPCPCPCLLCPTPCPRIFPTCRPCILCLLCSPPSNNHLHNDINIVIEPSFLIYI